jgi:hypothetical protein
MGSMLMNEFIALKAVEAWLGTDFVQGWEEFKDLLHCAAESVAALDNRITKCGIELRE